MRWFNRMRIRARTLWRRRQLDRDLDDELRFHLEMLAEDGSSARRRFGNTTLVREACRELWTLGSIEIWWQDVVYALRLLRKSKAFTCVMLATLALAMGANTAMFSVVNGVMLRSLPFPDAGHLAILWTTTPKDHQDEGETSVPNYQDWKRQSRAFQDLSFYSLSGATVLDRSDHVDPESVLAGDVAPNLFSLLGVAPKFGRVFSDSEAANGEHLIVLSDQFWRHRLGGAPDVVGQTVDLDGTDYRIIGIMPDGFWFPAKNIQFWRPVAGTQWWTQYNSVRRRGAGVVVGRLRSDATFQQAEAEMRTIAGRLELQYPESNSGLGVRVVPLHAQMLGKSAPSQLKLLFGAVLFVLLIACANMAHLLMARGAARAHEFSLRTALGAGRMRLIRQMLTESIVLALGGACLGLPLAVWGVDLLARLGPRNIPRLEEIRVDGRVLVFTFAVAVLSGILFGIAPAIKASLGNRRLATRALHSGRVSRRRQGVLVIAEFSLAMVLVTGAGLLVRSFLAVLAVDPGFRPEHVITMEWNLRHDDVFFEQAMANIRAIPGVEAVGAINDIFFDNADKSRSGDSLREVEGHPREPRDQWKPLVITPTTGDVLRALGIRLLRGRYFSDSDGEKSPLVVIVNEAMARRFWPGQNPIGRRFKGYPGSQDWVTVVGLVQDVHNLGLERQAVSQMFAAPRQFKPGSILVVRGNLAAEQLGAAVRSVIHSMDKRAAMGKVSTLEQQLYEQTSQRRFQSYVLGLFSLLALILAGVGIYGLLHYSVAQRTREIGVRMALGARPGDVMRLVARDGLAVVLVGLAFGTMASLALMRVISSLLFGVRSTDPATFVGGALLLAVVAMIACYVPARRATRVDPMIVLRSE